MVVDDNVSLSDADRLQAGAARAVAERHGTHRPMADEALFKGKLEKFAKWVDGDNPPMALLAIQGSGRGRCEWRGFQPPQMQREMAMLLTRGLYSQIRPQTLGAWLVCLGNWNPAASFGACYDNTIIGWCDPDGDVPFVIENDDSAEVWLGCMDNLLAECWLAFSTYGLYLLDAGIRPEHMSCKIAYGRDLPALVGDSPTLDPALRALGVTWDRPGGDPARVRAYENGLLQPYRPPPRLAPGRRMNGNATA